MNKKYELNMCEGSILKVILLFAIPLMCTSILQLVYNAADVIVVGRFAGKNSLAAVGSTGSLVNLIINLFIGFSIGVNVVIARAFGSGNRQAVSRASHTAVILGFISGVVVLILGLLLSEKMLIIMDTPEEVLHLAALYLKIYFIGAPANMVYNFGAGVLRAMGDTRRPLYYLTISGVVNVLLNLLFVIKFKMDVAGVALATIISQYISATLILNCLRKSDGLFEIKKLKIHKQELIGILKIGFPSGIQSMAFSLSNVIIQATINSFGAAVMAGNAAAGNIEGFVYVAMNAFHHAAITFIAQNIGGGQIKRMKKGVWILIATVAVIGITAGNVAVFFSENLLSIYSAEAEVIRVGMLRMTYVCGTYFLCGLMDVAAGVIRGFSVSFIPMVVSLLGACAFRIVWIYTVFAFMPTLEILYSSYPVSWLLTFSAHMICYKIISKKKIEMRNNMAVAEY